MSRRSCCWPRSAPRLRRNIRGTCCKRGREAGCIPHTRSCETDQQKTVRACAPGVLKHSPGAQTLSVQCRFAHGPIGRGPAARARRKDGNQDLLQRHRHGGVVVWEARHNCELRGGRRFDGFGHRGELFAQSSSLSSQVARGALSCTAFTTQARIGSACAPIFFEGWSYAYRSVHTSWRRTFLAAACLNRRRLGMPYIAAKSSSSRSSRRGFLAASNTYRIEPKPAAQAMKSYTKDSLWPRCSWFETTLLATHCPPRPPEVSSIPRRRSCMMPPSVQSSGFVRSHSSFLK